jgi:hypothetical protein
MLTRAARSAAVLAWRGVVYVQSALTNVIHIGFSFSGAIAFLFLPAVAIFDPFGLWLYLDRVLGQTYAEAFRYVLGSILCFSSGLFAYKFFGSVRSNWGLENNDELLPSSTNGLVFTISWFLSWLIILCFLGYFAVLRLAISSEGFADTISRVSLELRKTFIDPYSAKESLQSKNVESATASNPESSPGTKSRHFFRGQTLSGADGKFILSTNQIDYGLIQEVYVGSTFELHTKHCIYSGYPFKGSTGLADGASMSDAKLIIKSSEVGWNCELPRRLVFRGSSTAIQLEWYSSDATEPYTELFTTSYWVSKP